MIKKKKAMAQGGEVSRAWYREQFGWNRENIWGTVKDEEAKVHTVKIPKVKSQAGSPQCISPRGSIHTRTWLAQPEWLALYVGHGPNVRIRSLLWIP